MKLNISGGFQMNIRAFYLFFILFVPSAGIATPGEDIFPVERMLAYAAENRSMALLSFIARHAIGRMSPQKQHQLLPGIQNALRATDRRHHVYRRHGIHPGLATFLENTASQFIQEQAFESLVNMVRRRFFGSFPEGYGWRNHLVNVALGSFWLSAEQGEDPVSIPSLRERSSTLQNSLCEFAIRILLRICVLESGRRMASTVY